MHSRDARLSDAGRRVLGSVRDAFDQLAQLARAEKPPARRLRVGVSVSVSVPPTFACSLLVARLPSTAFYRPSPEVDIRFGRGRVDDRPAAGRRGPT